jgi:ribosomal protein S6
MRPYELTYLANPQLNEEEKSKLDEAVDEQITKQGGNITYASAANAPGNRRRLHYPIKDNRVAWLRVIQLDLEPANIEDLRATITKNKDVLRTTIVQTTRREEVSGSVFDSTEKRAEEKKETKASATKKVTMKEVEEKIEEALTEEVK